MGVEDEDQDREPTPEERGDVVPGGEGAEGKGEEGKGAEGKGAEGKGAEGKGEEGKGEEGKGEEGKGEEGKGEEQPGPNWIPRHRYNQMARRVRELESKQAAPAQGEQGEQGGGSGSGGSGEQGDGSGEEKAGSQKTEAELDEVSTAIAQAHKDGDSEKLAELYGKQGQLLKQHSRQVAEEAASTSAKNTTDEAAYDRRLDEVETTYPQLNPDDTDSYDDALAQRVMRMRNAYLQEGYSMVEALDSALSDFDDLLKPSSQPGGESKEGDGGKGDGGKSEAEAKAEADRKAAAVTRNAEAEGAQPSNLDGVGEGSDQHGEGKGINVTQMSEEEFDALPDSTLRRLRGDSG